MGDYEISEGTHSLFCLRCGEFIEAGEKMVSLSLTLESPTDDGAVEITEAGTVSTLCQGCAAVLLRPGHYQGPEAHDAVSREHPATGGQAQTGPHGELGEDGSTEHRP